MESATLVDLPPRQGERVTYELEERRFCNGNPDFYRIELGQAERMRIELFHDPGIDDLNLRLHSEEIETEEGFIQAAELNVPEVITFPPANASLDATTYYLEVYGDILGGMDYSIRFTVVDATNPCFNVGDEPNDNSEEAIAIVEEDTPIIADICAEDEDWFTFPMHVNDGMELEVITPSSQGMLIVELYSASGLALGLQNSAYDVETPDERPEGKAYVISVEPEIGGFTDDDYFLRIRGATADSLVQPYRLELNLTVVAPCGDDEYEPNNGLIEASALEELLPEELDGELFSLDVDHTLANLAICPNDDDFFSITVEDGEILEAWILDDGISGDLSIEFRDDQGALLGRSAGLSDPQGEPDIAVYRGTMAGIYYLMVNGLESSQGDYTLVFRRREVAEGLCSEDVVEIEGERNDISGDAMSLPDVSEGQERQFEFAEGYLCDVDGSDDDWYRFSVPEPNSRICVTLNGFRHEDANVDMELYMASGNPDGGACLNDAQCDEARPGACTDGTGTPIPCGGFCIEGHCTGFQRAATTNFNNEIIEIDKGVVGERNGDRLLRIFRDDGGNSAYRVTATVTPEDEICPRDWQEYDSANDSFDTPTFLGSGQIAACDTWICGAEVGDNFQVTVPAQEDRSIMISYQANVDGQLYMYFFESLDIQNMYAGLAMGSNSQCINVRGGEEDRDWIINVLKSGNPRDDGDDRIDYALRIVDTNLDLNPTGACNLLGATNLDACPEGENGFLGTCWPIAQPIP